MSEYDYTLVPVMIVIFVPGIYEPLHLNKLCTAELLLLKNVFVDFYILSHV